MMWILHENDGKEKGEKGKIKRVLLKKKELLI